MKAPDVDEVGVREAVRAVLADYAHGVDRGDWDLVRSCYHPDATDHHGVVVGTVDDLIAHMSATLDFAGTAHYELQSRIRVDGQVAHAESSSVAIHWHDAGSGRPDLWMGVRYVDRFTCRRGDWRIEDRRTVLDWVREVDGPDTDWPVAHLFLRGRPDVTDPACTDTPPIVPTSPEAIT